MDITNVRKNEIDTILKNSEESIRKNTVKTVPFSEFLAHQNERSKLMNYQYIVENTVSKTIQNYMRENNLSFTLKELAAIAYNSNMPHLWKMESLQVIASETDDMLLKQQIEELVALETFQCEKFREETEHTFYLLYNSKDHELEGLYKKADLAYKEGLSLKEGFRIEKYNLKGSGTIKGYSRDGVFEKEVNDLHAEAWKNFDSEGILKSFYSDDANLYDEEKKDLLFNQNRFQNGVIYFPNPFEKGDIVRSVADNIVGVVETSQKEWEELRNHKNNDQFDFWDYNLIVRPIGEGHNPGGHYHLLPIHLELVQSSNEADNYKLLSLASKLIKHEFDYEDYNTVISAFLPSKESNRLIYTDMTKKAMMICFEVHKSQTDKSGLPYVFHPFHLAEQMNDELSVTVALLHDVVEDSEITFDDLQDKFPETVINSLRLLTHQDGVKYEDYIEQIKNDEVARKVKIADLKHNMDLSRLDDLTKNDIERFRKYRKALLLLED